MQPTWRVYLLSALVSCAVAAGTALIVVRLATPRAGQSAGAETRQAAAAASTVPFSPPPASQPVSATQTVVQEGLAQVHLAQSGGQPYELEVFYKVPFATPPYLSFPDGLDDCEVADQKPGSFKLRRYVAGGNTWAYVKWKAEGMPAK